MNAGRFVLTFLLTLCLAAATSQAQDPKGTELRVNHKPAGTQWLPDVAAAANGRFVVVWQEGGDGQDQTQPVFVKARLFDAAGQPRGGEILVARHVRTPYPWPAVAMAPDGRFVVVWGGGAEDLSLAFGRRFAADGRPLGPQFRLATRSGQDSPDVAMAPDGSFVAAWTQGVEGDAEVNTDIYLRRFGADGRPLGPEVFALGDREEESIPKIAMRPNGDFVIVCQEWTDPYDILARRFSASGEPLGDAFQVNDGPTRDSSQFDQAVAMAADGRFAIVWTDRAADWQRDSSLAGDDATGVAIRFYAADGGALGPERFVNVFLPGLQWTPAISALQNGSFLVVWASGAGQDGDGFGIFARVYSAQGAPRGREFRINLNRAGSQSTPAVAVGPKGQGAAVWGGPDGEGTGVFVRRIGPPGREL